MATSLIEPERIRSAGSDDPRPGGRYVLYWMQSAQRARHNQALEHAIRRANDIGVPVAVMFCVVDGYPEASARHYDFMLRGLAETAGELRRRKVAFDCRHGDPTDLVPEAASEASLLVMDEAYLDPPRTWRADIIDRLGDGIPIDVVETEVVVPTAVASDKLETAARTIRPKIEAVLDDFVVELSTTAVDSPAGDLHVPGGSTRVDLSDVAAVLDTLDIAREPGPVEGWPSGTSAAMTTLQHFVDTVLADYDDARNRYDEDDSSSRLSPYLHYGQISPVEIVRRVRAADAPESHVASFVEELVVRRELAVNHALHNPDHDSYTGLPEWARTSLDRHADDPRDEVYTAAELEAGETDDEVWNAIMFLIREDGWVHNQLRMYWGKQVVHWTGTPGHAYRTLLELNNRYFLDGRDVNSYANVAWCFGRHDRGFAERDVSGKIRPFTTAALKRKGDLDGWLARTQERMSG